ncbi:MAG: alkaline phosphatase [Microcoleaceae cyanobacterium MO_207.B10]|nr:alkaline phosphatase [Microcoleaceae cyanobacterium MO_207.B10]
MSKNVILVIGDGMGWEMTRAGAIHEEIINELAELGYNVATGENTSDLSINELKAQFAGRTLDDYYTQGKGFGQSYQDLLDGYVISTDANTVIEGEKSNSLIEGSIYGHNTGEGPIRTNENGEELEFKPTDVFEGGNVPIFDLVRGGVTPWDENYYENFGNTEAGFDPEYIKEYYPDSAGTATGFHTGTKTYVGAIGVDIYEQDVESMVEIAMENGFAAGVVSSVPWSHATPAAGIAHTSGRNKTTEESNISSYWTFPESDLLTDVPTDDEGNELVEFVTDDEGNILYARYGVDDDGNLLDSEGNVPTLYETDEDGNNIYATYGVDEDGNLLDEHDHAVEETDNIFDSVLEVAPNLILGAGHPEASGNERYITQADIDLLKAGDYDTADVNWNFIEREENVDGGQALFELAQSIDPDNGEHLWGVYGQTGQNNLPWRTADSDYGATGTNGYSEDGLLSGDELAADILENPTVTEMTEAALEYLGQADEGFYLMVEVGDIDWSAHANNMDLMLGTQLDISDTVRTTHEWILENGGYEENLLMVTADHDHYLTLLDNFPELLANSLLEDGGESITPAFRGSWEEDSAIEVGHFWGTDISDGDQWGTHTSRPVPLYYQGPEADEANVESLKGTGYTAYGKYVPGVSDFIDQVHIKQVSEASLLETEVVTAESLPLEIEGSSADNIFNGGAGDDTMLGAGGNDTLAGGSDNDVINGGSGNDRIFGQAGNDVLIGRRGNDFLSGGAGNDTIEAGIGRDRLNGGRGNDELTGGGSIDRFIFNTNRPFASQDLGVDTITDLQPDLDLILVDTRTFTEITTASGGNIGNEFQTVSSNPATSSGIIVYDSSTGGLFYNANGSAAGLGDGGQFAILSDNPTLTADNFQIR